MKKHFFSILLIIISFPIFSVIGSLFDIIGIGLLSTIAWTTIVYAYVPILTFSIASIYKTERKTYLLKVKKNIPKFLILTILFIGLTTVFNTIIYVVQDYDGYQEEALSIFLNGSMFLVHSIIFLFLFIKIFLNNNNFIAGNNRKIFFSSFFMISIIFFTLNLININSCSDDPLGFVISFVSILFCVFISVVDLIMSLIKKYFSYALLVYTFGLVFSAFTLFYLHKIFDNDGKCNIFIGPSDSAMTLTFLLISLYSFMTKKITKA